MMPWQEIAVAVILAVSLCYVAWRCARSIRGCSTNACGCGKNEKQDKSEGIVTESLNLLKR